MEIIRLTTCNNIVEATMLKNNLENEGIPCFLTNENFTTLMPGFNGMIGSGIQIMINDSDFEKASILISTNQIDEIIRCPNCKSENVKYGLGTNKWKKIVLIIISILTWIPFNNLKNTYYCKNCKTEFKI